MQIIDSGGSFYIMGDSQSMRLDIIKQSNTQTMWQYLAVSLIAVITYLAYALYFKPRRQISAYIKQMSSLGYRVYEYPFAFMGASYAKRMQWDLKHHKDIFHTHKHILPHYDAMVSNVFGGVYIYFVSPSIIKHINTIDKAILLQKNSIVLTLLEYLGDQGLVTANGMLWKNHRKLLSKIFNYDFVKSQVPSIIRIVDQVIQNQVARFKPDDRSVEVNLCHMFSQVTSLVVLSGFLGIESLSSGPVDAGKDLQLILRELMDNIVKLGTTDPLLMLGTGKLVDKRLTKTHTNYSEKNHIFRKWIKSHIENIRQNTKSHKTQSKDYQPKTMIEAIILENQQQQTDAHYNEKQLIDEIMTFILAGTDTTANFLTFLAAQIAKRPEVLARVVEEITKHIKRDGDITVQNLKNMHYIDWVMKQVSRMYNPAPSILARRAPQNIMLGDIPISKGTRVSFMILSMLHDPKKFKDPHEFRPQRWEHSTGEQESMIGLAFGGGPRSCIGKHLALLESKIAIIKFFQNFRQVIELNERVTSASLAYCIDNPVVKLIGRE